MFDPIEQRAVTPAQLRMLHGVARKAGMDDELLHAKALALTGKEHLTGLTCKEAAELIDSITGVDTSNRRQYNRPLNRASQQQINHILSLARMLGWLEEGYGRLNAFLHKRYDVERLDWLTPDMAQNVIEAMKAMLKGGRGERVRTTSFGEQT